MNSPHPCPDVNPPVEPAERALAPLVARWMRELGSLDADDDTIWQALFDALSLRCAEAAGLASHEWPGDDRVHDTELLAHARALIARDLACPDTPSPDTAGRDTTASGALWHDPHLLGWFHQHAGSAGRAASFRAHHRAEAKHASATVSTRLYTPRWIADLLAGGALSAFAPDRLPTVCDPAVGGGQMLLAAYDALRARFPAARAPELVACLYGTDLDPRAVRVARRNLELHAVRHSGRRDPEISRTLARQIRVADGLARPANDRIANDTPGTFDLVLTNPPYMGSRSMPPALKQRLARDYAPFHADLYVAFIRRCQELARVAIGVLAQQTVWYLARFAPARERLLERGPLTSFVHLGPRAFFELSGEKASVVAFVQKMARPDDSTPDDSTPDDTPATFVDLRDARSPQAKREQYALAMRTGESVRTLPLSAFAAIPGRPLAHWLDADLRRWFRAAPHTLGELADIPGSQNKTGANARFVHPFGAVDPDLIRDADGLWRRPGRSTSAPSPEPRFAFYSKGGRYAPWWGHWQYVVDWSPDARAFYRDHRTANLLASRYWYRRGLCYTDFGGRNFNARILPEGCLFDMTGPAIFPHPVEATRCDDTRLHALLAILNSSAARELLNAMNPTLHYQVRDLRNLPLPALDPGLEAELATRARALVDDLRTLARFTPADPLFDPAAARDPEARAHAHAALARHAAREAELDALVADLYGWSPPAAPDRAEHVLLAAARAHLASGK